MRIIELDDHEHDGYKCIIRSGANYDHTYMGAPDVINKVDTFCLAMAGKSSVCLCLTYIILRNFFFFRRHCIFGLIKR